MSRPAQNLNLIDYALAEAEPRRATEFSGANRILTGATFLRPINEKLARNEKLKTTLSIQPCVIARSARIRREKARRSYRSSFARLSNTPTLNHSLLSVSRSAKGARDRKIGLTKHDGATLQYAAVPSRLKARGLLIPYRGYGSDKRRKMTPASSIPKDSWRP
jgi:hypothetical protein